MNRVNIITLGVEDLQKSFHFYRDGLGFKTSIRESNPSIVFFQNAGTRLALYPIEHLSKDSHAKQPPKRSGFPGFTLAYNATSAQEVDEVLNKAEKTGGIIQKSPHSTFWGGYSGYFSDPDGYYWEVAYSEGWRFDHNEMLIIE
ncbi:VOC family protein [Bacillus weihaiensis]|uniref:Glyoxalase n=1 Tax=Bacillus weihaiensis TaxID=1547283 RepID=A0A1L3MTK6_9BACI|nr:VOC family protein [Bacillus weihaiensis]APH05630.1 glyoxalase [Bacillus weihaiensis]